MTSWMKSRGARYVLVLFLLAATGLGAWSWARSDAARPVLTVAPYEYLPTSWRGLLAAPNGLDASTLQLLDSTVEGLDPESAAALKSVAEAALLADLTGMGRSAFEGYWPPSSTAGPSIPRCSHVDVLATSPALLPASGGEYAKVLVAWHGECRDAEDDHEHAGESESPPRVTYLYAVRDPGGWKPLREWELPAEEAEDLRIAAPPLPEELGELSSCDGTPSGERARLVVVEAWRQLCAEAAAAGVDLQVGAGYRDATQQASLYEEAIEEGVEESIPYADGTTCDSKHCDGTAVDAAGPGVLWLHAPAGCLRGGVLSPDVESCEGQLVLNLTRYGFSAPDPGNPSHLEFLLPLGSRQVANCAPSRSITVPEMVAQIFRCRLAREGVDPETTAAATAEALVVSQCESLWNARALALNGKFALAPDPVTGQKVTEAGVFMLPDALGKWAPEGDGRLDPVANINAAASLWLATRDWSQWECATGLPSPYASGPVLPQYGGPELPDWAFRY